MYITRSWFRDGRFVPSVGIWGLFEGKAIPWKKGYEFKNKKNRQVPLCAATSWRILSQ